MKTLVINQNKKMTRTDKFFKSLITCLAIIGFIMAVYNKMNHKTYLPDIIEVRSEFETLNK